MDFHSSLHFASRLHPPCSFCSRPMLAAAIVIIGFSWPPLVLAQAEAEFRSLFDGKTLDGWRGYGQTSVPSSWSVAEGAIRGDGNGPDLITTDQFSDFDLRFEWKLGAGGNSGVIYRVSELADTPSHASGIEYQLLDDTAFQTSVPPTHGCGAIYGLMGDPEKDLRPIGQYNTSRIVVRGDRLEHWLNDELVAIAVIGSADWQQRVAASKFHNWSRFAKARRGHIALQAHGSVVWFRNLRILDLSDVDPP